MEPETIYLAAAVFAPRRVLRPGWVRVRNGAVCAVGSGMPSVTQGEERRRLVDLGDHMIAPGFVDLHVHGGGGAQVNGDDPDQVAAAVRRIAHEHARHGTTALLATTVSDTHERLSASLAGIAEVCRDPAGASGAVVVGSHLEGPWLAPEWAGAQDLAALRLPDPDEFATLANAADGTLRMVTLAPEMPGGTDLIRRVVGEGAVAAVGHTGADAAATRAAFDAGARHVTHLFNRMPALGHRDPGPIGVALADPRVTVDLIADGAHIAPEALLVVAAAAPGRVALITDAVAAAGLGDGSYRLGTRDVIVKERRASLADEPGTLAGSVLTMDQAVAGFADAGIPVEDAIVAASEVPARILGDRTRGRLAAGCRADFTVLDRRLHCVATLIAGEIAHDELQLSRPTEHS